VETGDTNPGQGRPLRRTLRGRQTLLASATALPGAFARVMRNPDRPSIFDLLFWSILVLTYAFHVFAPHIPVRGTGLAQMTVVCAVLVAVWLVLPWHPSASRRRKLLALAFLGAATVMLFASDLIWALGLYPIAFANGVFLFGLRRGVAYAAATLFALFVTTFIRSVSSSVGSSPETVIERWALIALLTVVCLGLSGAVMEARRNRERAESLFGDLEAAHAELKRYAERVRELTLSEERTRIAQEIHDSVGHHLTAVKLQAEAAVKTAEKRPDAAREQMERARDLAARAFEEVHRSVRALKPPPTGERSGVGALRALVRSFDGTGLDIRFRVEGKEQELAEEAELALYRALQEGLTNAARHSDARQVDASLAYGNEGVKLAVADDGRGATEEATMGGFGLSALKNRVEALGGVFAAENAPGGGFAVKVELPSGEPSGKPLRAPRETP
jgi:signal transduction histidine kinase